MKKLFILFTFTMMFAQTDVSGNISGTWSITGSPYNIVGDVDIITTLDIEPGVEIICTSTSSLGHSINVYGLLTANGTSESPIIVNNPNGSYDNNGATIIFNNSWNGSSISHVEFQGVGFPMNIIGNPEIEFSDIKAEGLWSLFGSNNQPTDINDIYIKNIELSGRNYSEINGNTMPLINGGVLENITITESKGILLENFISLDGAEIYNNDLDLNGESYAFIKSTSQFYGEPAIIKNVNIHDNNCDYGGSTINTSWVDSELSNIIIQNNGYCDGIYTNENVVISYNLLISGNQTAYTNHSNSTIYNSTIVNNNRGFAQGGGEALNIYNSISYFNDIETICGQSNQNVQYSCMQSECFGSENGNITSNPMFLNFDDYIVHDMSPIIDAGNSNYGLDECFPPSMGTSAPDIGHNGGPGACDWDESYEPTTSGCTDPNANNYDSNATIDDGTCNYDIYGCTDSSACNYDNYANVDNGTCEYNVDCNGICGGGAEIDDCGECGGNNNCYGCTDSNAINYDENANIDDGSCYYQTLLSGSVSGALTSAGNPHVMTGDVYCNNCTFEEGVEINVSPGGYKIMYMGTFTVNGAEENPVIIKSISGSNSSWGGITNQGDASNNYAQSFDDVNINYLELSDAVTGFEIADTGTGTPNEHINISNSIFSNCGFGVTLKNGTISNGVTSHLNIDHTVFKYNSIAGIYVRDNAEKSITNCTIVYNNNGINLTDSGEELILNSNIIAFNSSFGICRSNLNSANGIDFECTNSASDSWFHPVSVTYNTIFNNNNFSFDIEQNSFGMGEISGTNANGDPSDALLNIYVNPSLNEDYTLTSDSPCIDAGDFLLPYDPDGTIADIGAYYYDQTGSGDISGCTDPIATNYNPNATVDDGTCEYDDNWNYGCTYETATNYNPDATFDDGSCEFMFGDFNQDGTINIMDIVAIVNFILNGW